MRLRVNPITCEGHGACAELLPELITLDPWGYPILARGEVPRELAGQARRAAAACPTLALLAERPAGRSVVVPAGPGGRRGGRHAGRA